MKTQFFAAVIAIASLINTTQAAVYEDSDGYMTILFPPLTEVIYELGTPHQISSDVPGYLIPSVPPGKSLRIQYVIPPGVTTAGIGGTSNLWNAGGPGKQPIFGFFNCNPGKIDVAKHRLTPVSGGLSLRIHRPDDIPIEEPFYSYFIVHNLAEDTHTFSFGRFEQSMSLDPNGKELYKNWAANGRARPTVHKICSFAEGVYVNTPHAEAPDISGLIASHQEPDQSTPIDNTPPEPVETPMPVPILDHVDTVSASGYTSLLFPPLTETIYIAGTPHHLTSDVSGSVFPEVSPGEALRIQFVIPPGATAAGIGGTSNFWNSSGTAKQPVFGFFNCNPGSIDIAFSHLAPASGGLALRIQRPDNIPLNEAFYSYFIIYNPPGDHYDFKFGRFEQNISFPFSADAKQHYSNWVNSGRQKPNFDTACDFSAHTLATRAFLSFSGLDSQTIRKVGDIVNLSVVESDRFPRAESVDLWAAVQIPSGGFLYFKTPTLAGEFVADFNESLQVPVDIFSAEPQAFKFNVGIYEKIHDILTVKAFEAGKYVLYALYMKNGKNPMRNFPSETDWRSNLASATVTIVNPSGVTDNIPDETDDGTPDEGVDETPDETDDGTPDGGVDETPDTGIVINDTIDSTIHLSNEPIEFSGMLEAHNVLRRQVGVSDLGWSTEVAQVAQNWANTLKEQSCEIERNPALKDFGENIIWFSGFSLTPQEIVDVWSEEKENFDPLTGLCAPDKVCGHYTQIVWHDTMALGCGRATCGFAEIWVCNYSPAGNVNGEKPF